MTTEQFQRVKQLFLELQDLAPDEQGRALDRACADDPQTRKEVEKLLRHDEEDAPADQMLSRFSQHIEQALGSRSGTSREMVGQRVGPYEVIGNLGQGGMGVVYLGRDTRLARMAALKAVLPGDAENAARVERLRREARVLASLSHPNLATVYGLEEAHGTLFLAMEYIEGKTLSQRLGRSALPIAEALKCCEQIAAGLEAAHEEGVIHRDLKPGNVMFTADNTAKVLDFGLARELRSSRDLTRTADTRVLTLTRQGSFFGTPAYMSPEQARGESLDRRSDIFSFGALMFRCLTGKPAFDGETDAEIIDVILTREPEWELLPSHLPQSIRTILRRCLAKNPADRYRHIGDVRLDLHEALVTRPWEDRGRSAPRWKAIFPWAAAVLLAAGGGATGLFWPRHAVAPAVVVPQRFDLTLPEEAVQTDLERIQVAISPDGKRIVVACSTPKVGRALWMRTHQDGQWRLMPQTLDAHRPFFSAEGQWIGFHRASHVFKCRFGAGGEPIRLGTSTNWYGASFTDDGGVIVAPAWNTGLTALPTQGGAPASLTRLDEQSIGHSHISPAVVPGTRWVLYNVWTGGEDCDIHAVNLDTGQTHLIARNASTPTIAAAPRGAYLLFERASSIFAVRFDVQTGKPAGPESVIVDGVLTDGTRFASYFDVADDGTLVYFPGSTFAEENRLAYVNEDGTTTPFNDDRLPFCEPLFSADGTKLAAIIKGKVYHALIYDLERKTKDLLPIEGDVTFAAPTPDGEHFALSVNREGGYGIDLYSPATGRFVRRIVKPGIDYATDGCVSPDGSFMTYASSAGNDKPRDVYIIEMKDGAEPRPLVATPTADMHPVISPNCKWVACVSEITGRREIHVAVIPDGKPMRQISFGGGENPLWSPDGKFLYYIAPEGLTRIAMSPEGVATSPPQVIYNKPFGQSDSIARNMTISPDGRVLIVEPSEKRATVSHLHVITNWHRLLP